MSKTTREINRITTTIMSVSCKVVLYALVLFLLYEGVTRGYSCGHEIFDPTPMSQEPGITREFVIGEGDTVKTVAKALEEDGLIRDKWIFILQAKIYEYEIHAGSYELNTSMTSKDMLKLIDAGGENKKGGA